MRDVNHLARRLAYRKRVREGMEVVQDVVWVRMGLTQRRFATSIVSALHSSADYPPALLPFVATE